MAKPQLENGYLKIANDIYDAFARTRIRGETRQIVDFIIRKTYGFNKKSDKISLSQFVLGTGLKKPIICRAIDNALELRLIIKKDNDIAKEYKFNKDFEKWKPLSKKITIIKKDNKSLSNLSTTKDNNTKYNNADSLSANREVSKSMEYTNTGEPILDPEEDAIKSEKLVKRKNHVNFKKFYAFFVKEIKTAADFQVTPPTIQEARREYNKMRKDHDDSQIVEIIKFFLKSDKFKKYPSIHACFSTDTLNQWQKSSQGSPYFRK